MFIICCLPIFTAPAAVMAMNRYLIKMYRDGYAFDMTDFFKEFKSEIFRALPLGILSAAVIFYGFYIASLAGNYRGTDLSAMMSSIGIICMTVGTVFAAYAFTMAAILELNITGIIRNSVIFILIEWKANLKLILLLFISVFLSLSLLPFSFIISIINEVIDRRILKSNLN